MQSLDQRRRSVPLVVVWVSLFALVSALTWVGGLSWYHGELSRIESQVAAGDFQAAKRRLERLAWLGSKDPEVLFWVGACEEAEGNVEAALDAWGRVPRGSPPWVDATVRRAQLALARGRFAEAETALLAVQPPPDHPAASTCEQLRRKLYLFTIRYDELRRQTVEEWSNAHKPETLRVHWLVDETKSFPVGATRDRLDQAGRDAPDDDRVWLGKANLAIRIGKAGGSGDLARALPPTPARRSGRLARQARLGRGVQSARGGDRGIASFAGKLSSRRSCSRAPGLAFRSEERSRGPNERH